MSLLIRYWIKDFLGRDKRQIKNTRDTCYVRDEGIEYCAKEFEGFWSSIDEVKCSNTVEIINSFYATAVVLRHNHA